MGQGTKEDLAGSREGSVNKRQKKKLFKKRAGFYPPGGPDALRFQIWTGIGMTKSKWKKFNETLKEIFETTEYDHNTRNVENFNRLMRKR
jgi:hypothetical protein